MFSKNLSKERDVFDGVPRGRPNGSAENFTAPSARFASTEAVVKHLSYRTGDILLGAVNGCVEIDPRTQKPFVNGGQLIGAGFDDRHLVTVGGNRSGKGRCAILPNLFAYTHSTLVLDIKGELATLTSGFRAKVLKHRVHVLDPFRVAILPAGVQRAKFNPLAGLTSDNVIERSSQIADALVVPSGVNTHSDHWEESSRNLIEAIICHIVLDPYYANGRVHLGTVRELLGEAGESGTLKDEMLANAAAGGVVMLGAKDFFDRAPNERMSVLSTARRHLKFLDFPEMRETLQQSDFLLTDLKTAATTIYICLPARHMSTCKRFMRLLINLALQDMENIHQKPVTGGPVLFCMDEFAALGHMKALEDAAGQIAGFGVKLWPILQDLTQLKTLYGDRWETFLGNAGVLQFFGNNDLTTLEWISSRCGRTLVKVPRDNPMSAERSRHEGVGAVTYSSEFHELLAVPEIANLFGRSDPQSRQLIIRADGLPLILQRICYDLHNAFRRLS